MTPLLQLLEFRKRRVAIDIAFDDLFMYSQFTEVALIEKAAERQAGAVTTDLFYPDLVTDDDIERFQNERRQLQEDFPQALRMATLGLTHSTFETQLIAIARLAAQSRGLKYPENVKTTWPAKTFLEKTCEVIADSKDWSRFKAYQSVRNAFIHNDGRVDLPLNDGSDPRAAAVSIGAEVRACQEFCV
jgi:hypothetical protein